MALHEAPSNIEPVLDVKGEGLGRVGKEGLSNTHTATPERSRCPRCCPSTSLPGCRSVRLHLKLRVVAPSFLQSHPGGARWKSSSAGSGQGVGAGSGGAGGGGGGGPLGSDPSVVWRPGLALARPWGVTLFFLLPRAWIRPNLFSKFICSVMWMKKSLCRLLAPPSSPQCTHTHSCQ